MQPTFRGVGVALVTPFKADLSIDFPALEKLISHVLENGVDFLVALGTTGETPTLSAAEAEEVLSFVIEKAEGRVPVVCGAGGNHTLAVIQQIKSFSKYDVAGWLSVAPYYNKPSQEGIYQHFKAIAESTDKPIILYNVPGRTVSNIQPATVLRLARDFKNIVAIKEASGSLPQCMAIVAEKPEGFTVLSGDDNLILSQIAIGMEGVISVAANCWPKSFSEAVHTALEGNFIKAREAFYPLLHGIDLLFAEGNPTGVKEVLAQQGMIENVLRLPLIPASETLATQLKNYMK